MFRVFKASAFLLAGSVLSGCISQPAGLVSEPLRPAPNEPAAYLVGAIGPQVLGNGGAATNLRLLFRKRGSMYGAAALWQGDSRPTPNDLEAPGSAGSVFVLPLKPGDYEFYNFQFWAVGYRPGMGSGFSSREAREAFVVPLRLEAGKAYYIGEYRSVCREITQCLFVWGDQMTRDAAIAQRQVPGLPTLQALPLNLEQAHPFIIQARPAPGLPAAAREEHP
jgi:hypothetical protein